jgi:hypothetical protein
MKPYDDMPIPKLPEPSLSLIKTKDNAIGWLIATNTNGLIFATKNFSDVAPIWRVYKRMGWAIRYVTGKSARSVQIRTIEL